MKKDLKKQVAQLNELDDADKAKVVQILQLVRDAYDIAAIEGESFIRVKKDGTIGVVKIVTNSELEH